MKLSPSTWFISNQLKVAAALLLVVTVVSSAYVVGLNLARQSAQTSSNRQLQLISLDLESILERYESLPFALSFLSEAAIALERPTDAKLLAHVNQVLQQVQLQAKVASIYLMDASGKTIATSNWDLPQSYIGKNFGFRPYFKDALGGQAGRFYGIGSTTAEPGYFIAQPVYARHPPGSPAVALGVVAVKISLKDIASVWDRLEDSVALVDSWGVIFLSNRPAWQYHSVERLSTAPNKPLPAHCNTPVIKLKP